MTRDDILQYVCGWDNRCNNSCDDCHVDIEDKYCGFADWIQKHFTPKNKLREILKKAPPIFPDVDPGLSREEILGELLRITGGNKCTS